ncbi:hypothetical protein NBH08_08370 [Faecalicatena sp. BF-R-105]|nr:hypothetical protein [Faecalicatena sp. BF-R-105]
MGRDILRSGRVSTSIPEASGVRSGKLGSVGEAFGIRSGEPGNIKEASGVRSGEPGRTIGAA